MAQVSLGKIAADFETSLAVKMAIGATSGTLLNATDDDGVALPTGRYFLTIDGNNSSKEHISCTLTSTALTDVKTLSRQGTETAGVLRAHRVGAKVTITDFAHIKKLNDLLDGTTKFDPSVLLEYSGTATVASANQLTTKAYVDAFRVSRVATAASTATLTPNCGTYDMYTLTAQGEALVIANNAGTPAEGQVQIIRIIDDGTARAISYGTDYREIGVALPSTTTLGKLLYLGFIWNDTDSKWDLVGNAQQS